MVSLRDAIFCGVAPSPPAADRRVERTCAAGEIRYERKSMISVDN
jgi:hypothetical protein